MIGQTIAHYKVTAKLGAGGMGVVYRAHDEHLDRDVALKVLPASNLGDPSARALLLREARAAASLNHPNICTIHEVGEADGQAYIAMELVGGQTLASLIAGGPLRLDQVLLYGTQIASALSHAHERQIIHRDLKSANIVITQDGRAKVLDFGLAKKLTESALDEATRSQLSLTRSGAVVGTLAYMAPEQLQGLPADARSDIWSLGVVIYEMATGKRPFRGETGLTLSAAILNQSPLSLPPQIAGLLRAVVERCLEKEPARRYQRASEAHAALEAVQSGTLALPTSWNRSLYRLLGRHPGKVAASVLALLTLATIPWWKLRPAENSEPLPVVALTTLPGIERSPSLSPDGNYVVFAWTGPKLENQDIYVQMIGQGSRIQLTTNPLDDYNPVWSPDGRWIAFLRSQPPAPTGLRSRELWVMPPLGGLERKIADIRGQDFPDALFLAWAADSKFLIATDSPGDGLPDTLVAISVETGEKRLLTNPQKPVVADTSPAISPDGSSLAFLRRTSWGWGELHVLPLGKDSTAAGNSKRLTPADFRADHPAWMPDGKEILFSAKGNLWRLSIQGENAPTRVPFLGEDGLMPAISRPQAGKPARLVYVRSSSDSNLWRIDVTAPGVPTKSAPVMAISSTKWEYHCRFSPDGRKVVFSSERSGDKEIWISDPGGTNAVQLTFMGAQETMCPAWSPDGQTIAFASNPQGEFDVYAVSVAGGKPRRLTSHPGIDICPAFSRDGNWIYFSSMRTGDYRVFKMPVTGGNEVQVTPNQGGSGAIEASDRKSIFYNTVGVLSSIWRMPIPGGKPVMILDGIIWFNYAVVENGIYFIDDISGEKRLRYFNFATGKSITIARNLGEVNAGLTVSPDGRTILFNRVDSFADDLMLVENFH